MENELLKALDPEGLDMSICGGGCRAGKGAIFDRGAGEYGQHILMPEQVEALLKLLDDRFNAGIEAALEALPEKEIQHPATHPDYNWGQEKTWNDCLDQARSNIERLKK